MFYKIDMHPKSRFAYEKTMVRVGRFQSMMNYMNKKMIDLQDFGGTNGQGRLS